jgi:hypothetical protein
MPVKVLEKVTFVYIAYHRQGGEDFAVFRRAVVNALKKNASFQDIVVDLTPNDSIDSQEKNLLTNAASVLAGTRRLLHLIARAEVSSVLEPIPSENARLYDSHQTLIESLKGNEGERLGR